MIIKIDAIQIIHKMLVGGFFLHPLLQLNVLSFEGYYNHVCKNIVAINIFINKTKAKGLKD
jgi:hypothetical protein